MNRLGRDSLKPPVSGRGTGSRISGFQRQSLVSALGSTTFVGPTASESCDTFVPFGLDTERSRGISTTENNSPSTCLRWARNLRSLLQDAEGLELFRKYLDQEGTSHANPLNFWFACEGLKEQRDHDKVHRLVKLIYKRFFLQSQLEIPENIREETNRRVKEDRVDERVFDVVQIEVERLINETVYPNFLRSDIYLRYVRSCQNLDSDGCRSYSDSSPEMYADISRGFSLPLSLRKNNELLSSVPNLCSASRSIEELQSGLRLTRNVLLITQQTGPMDLRSKSEVHTGDGMSIDRQCTSNKQYTRRYRATKESTNINRDPMAPCTVVPRAQCVSRDLIQPLKPEIFAQLLIEKLTNIKRERDTKETFDGHVRRNETIGVDNELDLSRAGEPRTLADTLREKLVVEDDSGQAILDRHVSRVWADSIPSRSSGRLPDITGSDTSHDYSRSHKQIIERNVFFALSADSGNIRNLSDSSDDWINSLVSHLPKPKSASSDYTDSVRKQDRHLLWDLNRRFQKLDVIRRPAIKIWTTTESTVDSSVSVIGAASRLTVSKDSRFLCWLDEADSKYIQGSQQCG